MYCAVSDMYEVKDIDYLLSTTNDIDNPIAVNIEILEAIIANVSETIDDYLRGKYPLPLLNKHNTLKQVCMDLVVFELLKRKRTPNDDDLYLFNNAINTLENIRKGKITLKEGLLAEDSELLITGICSSTKPSLFKPIIDKFTKRFNY